MLSSEDIEAIEAAKALHEKGQEFYNQVDELLTPICLKAIDFETSTEIFNLLYMLPPGFHRTELRVFAGRKYMDEAREMIKKHRKLI